MGASYSDLVKYGNPVLPYFGGFPVEPYWLIIVQLIFIQLLQRLYSKFLASKKDEKKSWYIPIEVAVLGTERTGVIPPKYSILDFILSLISFGQFGYAVYSQFSCSSAKNGNSWNCYNAFGYRLYNYVVPSVVSVIFQSVGQLINNYQHSKHSKDEDSGSMNCCKQFLLWSTIILNICLFGAFVPHLLSNVVPMLVIYFWVLVPVCLILVFLYTLCAATFVYCMQSKSDKKAQAAPVVKFDQKNSKENNLKGKKSKEKPSYILLLIVHILVGLQVFSCLALSMAYNYSQYSYYGAEYVKIIWLEFGSRDTMLWYNTLMNTTHLQIDTALAFF